MAINNIPGVGPSNADVANAVAAVVPDSADITAAVPTAAQIATAVAAPSAATIAAAVAAPSAATIAAAVAAPSSATIASAVAAAVPTLSQINSSVASNASPYGGTYTDLGTFTPIGSAGSITFTGLGGYKEIRIFITCNPAASDTLLLRMNGDSGSNYMYAMRYHTSASVGADYSYNMNAIRLNTASTTYTSGIITLSTANSTSIGKRLHYQGVCSSSSTAGFGLVDGQWRSTAALSSVTIFYNGGQNFSNAYFNVQGVN